MAGEERESKGGDASVERSGYSDDFISSLDVYPAEWTVMLPRTVSDTMELDLCLVIEFFLGLEIEKYSSQDILQGWKKQLDSLSICHGRKKHQKSIPLEEEK